MTPINLKCQALVFLCGILASVADKVYLPDDLTIAVKSLYPCENFEQKVEFSMKFYDINGKGQNGVDIDGVLEQELTEQYTTDLVLYKWIDDKWITQVEAQAYFCELIQGYIPKSWQKLRQDIVPSMPGSCEAQPGHYKIERFEINRDDYEMSLLDVGTYKLEMTVFDDDDTDLICYVCEVDVIERS